jgi:NodT family efflux transporter outer membrane factor (OMF) lipoprotein
VRHAKRARRAGAGLACLFAGALLVGCGTVGPAYQRPDLGVTDSDRFVASPSSVTMPTETDLNWWRRFNDPELASWVERALAGNLDVAAAFERVEEAQALLRAARAGGRPSVIGGVRTGVARRDAGGSQDTSGLSASAELDLAWDADLWGGQRQAERSAAAAVLRNRDLAQAARLATAGSAARVYSEWREALAEIRLLEEALQLREDSLRIARVRADVGLAPRFDVMRAQADLASAEAELAAVAAQARAAELALQVLAGERPGQPLASAQSASMERDGIPRIDGEFWIPRPVDLLRLRPDVRAAEQALAGAFADIGVAEAALYPQLQLPGQILLSATGLGAGSVAQTLTASLGALLQAPLLDGGRNRAALDAAGARAREAALVYRQTVLEAMQQVEAALVARQAIEAQIASLRVASEASAAALDQARTLYTEGLAGFLDVLEAQRTWLDNRRELAQARAEAARASIAAFEAIGLIGQNPDLAQVSE